MGHSGFTGRTAIRRRNKDIHTQKGLCRMCSRKAVEGKLSCQYHLDYFRVRRRLKKNGL